MSNHEKCMIVGIGDVRVVINNGHSVFFRNVRHILDLRLTVMSIEKLDYRRFTSHFANRVWKLLNGSFVVARENKYC